MYILYRNIIRIHCLSLFTHGNLSDDTNPDRKILLEGFCFYTT